MSPGGQDVVTTETNRSTTEESSSGLRSTLKSMLILGVVFALVQFAFSTLPIVSILPKAGLIGLFIAAFGIGLLDSSARYPTVVLMGLMTAALVTVVGNSKLLVNGIVPEVSLAIGIAGGAIVALVGYYFGRDLKAGVSQELP
ncbi:hypothetical protein [Halocatena halophila]|uniref:hypothetical protein n=1 Tax=Halocatena halophila TaxID=2814576 RepID=UPI002ED3E4A5